MQALNETIGAGKPLDLVMYGDGIVESLEGRQYGKVIDGDHFKATLDLTKGLLTKEGGGQIEALTLGIAREEVRKM